MLEATRAERWRLRAAEVRQAAAIMDDAKTRETLARLARTYEALAQRSEASHPAAGAGADGTAPAGAALPGHAITV
jgi:hypothetical protein